MGLNPRIHKTLSLFICIQMQAAMNTTANWQECWAVGVVRLAATGTLDDGCQADSDTEENDPEGKEPAQSAARSLQLKRDDQARHIDQNGCPEYPAAFADLSQPRSQAGGVDVSLHGQEHLLSYRPIQPELVSIRKLRVARLQLADGKKLQQLFKQPLAIAGCHCQSEEAILFFLGRPKTWQSLNSKGHK